MPSQLSAMLVAYKYYKVEKTRWVLHRCQIYLFFKKLIQFFLIKRLNQKSSVLV